MNNCTLYRYMGCKHLKDVIKSNSLYMSDGSEFNDPFDLIVVNKKSRTERRVDSLRIVCLTNSYRNKLMWSHYADGYKGVCLTVELPSDDVYAACYSGNRVYENSKMDEVIKKSKRYEKKNLVKDYSILSNEQKFALIKSKCWSYEREYRIVLSDYEKYKNSKGEVFYPVKITSLYLGLNFDEYKNRDIIELCEAKNIKIKRLEKSLSDNSLVLVRS